jgi:hypothetical protein
MTGPDSISDPVARRISYTESFPSARGSAQTRLGSTQLSSRLMTWHVVPLCWRVNWLGADMACHCTYWCHNYVMLMPSLSGSVTWVRSTGIRVGSAHPDQEDTWGASARMDYHLIGVCRHVRRPISMTFSPVASSLPPLHSGIVKTQFWQLSFLSKNQTPLNQKLWY